MEWLNPPLLWQADGDKLILTTNSSTDFWRKTHDGGIRDNGHFYFQPVAGDFTADVKLSGRYRNLYDQAGLMARLDEITWLKCGIEYVDGIQHVSAVVTRDFSDWSVVPLPHNPPTIWLRLARHGITWEVHYALDGERYHLLRQAYLTSADTVQVGLMGCSPKGQGFQAVFENFRIHALA